MLIPKSLVACDAHWLLDNIWELWPALLRMGCELSWDSTSLRSSPRFHTCICSPKFATVNKSLVCFNKPLCPAMNNRENQWTLCICIYITIKISESLGPESSWRTHLPWVPQTPYPRLQGMLPTLEPPLNQSELQAPARASRPHFQGRTGDVLSTGHPPKRGKPMACGTLWILEMFEVWFFGDFTMHEIKTSCCLTSDCPSPFLHAPNFASPDVPLWTSLRTPGTDSTYGPKNLDGSKWSKPFKNYYN